MVSQRFVNRGNIITTTPHTILECATVRLCNSHRGGHVLFFLVRLYTYIAVLAFPNAPSLHTIALFSSPFLAKAKVVASVWGTGFVQFLAAQAVLPQSI